MVLLYSEEIILLMIFGPIATAHFYCARYSLGTRVLRHTSSARARAKHLSKCSADGHCVNLVRGYFCWMHGDPHLFFGISVPFLIISIITKNKIICAWEVVIISRLLFRWGRIVT